MSYFDHWILISWYMNFANFVVLLMIWLMCFWIDFIDDYKFASWILSIVAKFWLLEVPSHCVMAKNYSITFNCVFFKGIWSFMKMWKFCGPLWERLCFEPKLRTLVHWVHPLHFIFPHGGNFMKNFHVKSFLTT
jgi:hypothetical protein